MKLNTKLGVGKKQDARLVLDGPLEVVLKQDNKRLDDLEARVAALTATLVKTEEPQEAPQPAPKPLSFTLDVRRREDGLVKEVKALDSLTGKIYYTFDVRRDQFGAVKNIAALPQ